MAHTKGPWVICWGRHGTYPLGVHNRTANVITAFGRPASPEAIANAHLIAAAPDLLAALKAIVAHDDGNEPGLWKFQSSLDAARVSIAAATGATS